MKSQFHALSFLSNFTPKTPLDAEFINSFLVQRYQITPKTPVFAPNFDANPLDVQSFILWYESGLNALKTSRYQNSIVLLGNCTLDTCEIIATIDLNPSSKGEYRLRTEHYLLEPSQIEEATEEDTQLLYDVLFAHRLQPNPNTLTLVPKYIPQNGDRVIFYDPTQDIQGVGVVRHIDPQHDVMFYCYFTYPMPNNPKRVGYSMRETPGYDIRTMIFENIDKENIPTTLGNSTSCFRRLGKELEKCNKVWKDKLLRVEPLQAKVPVGQKYYFITDKMEVRQELEKGTPTSHFRYLAGNYFTDHTAAMRMLGEFNDLLRDYLASDEWPQMQ